MPQSKATPIDLSSRQRKIYISSLSTCVHSITLLYLMVLHIQTAVALTQTIISSRKHPPGTHATGDMGVGLSQAFWGALRYPWQ